MVSEPKREKLFLGVFYLEEIELRCILDDPLHADGVTFQSRLVGNDGASASGLKKVNIFKYLRIEISYER